MYRKTLAFIDLDAVRANFALACALSPDARNIAVVKANAYGHGMRQVAEALADVAPALAVATIDEALELRVAGLRNELLVLEGAFDAEACAAARAHELTLMVHTREQVERVAEAHLAVWVKVDTGMHRLGIAPDEVAAVVGQLAAQGADVRVICTHLACADELDNTTTRRQLERFRDCTADLGVPLSIANSAGILGWPDSHADWNRPGYMLYGASPFATDVAAAAPLRPAMALVSEIIAVRDMPAGASVGYGGRWRAERPSRIATVAAGYADGYPRHAPNGTQVYVNGRVAPLVGTVSMDMITIDVTQHDAVAVGDPVELWGRNVSVNEVAARAGTIGYELLTSVSARVPRIYD